MRAYVTGGTGFVGSNIVKLFAEIHGATVHCPVHSFVPAGETAYTIEKLDLLDADAVAASIARFAPDVIVHSMILNDHDLMYRDRDLAWRSYVDTTAGLASAANEVDAKLILVSTDWVFDGTQVGADEAEPPNPINYYGVLKAVSEQAALVGAERPAIARVSAVNGMHWARDETPRLQDPGFGYFVSTLVRALRAGDLFGVWEGEGVNMVASPSLATGCAEVMWAIANINDATGIFHCCGSEATTRMQLAELACDVFDLDAGLLRSIPAPADATPGWPVPLDTSLTVDRTRTVLGYEPPSPTELLERFRSEMETGEMSVGVK